MARLAWTSWKPVGGSWVLDLSTSAPAPRRGAPVLAVYRTRGGQWASCCRASGEGPWIDVWPTWARREDAQRALVEYATRRFGPEWRLALAGHLDEGR
jgi:hypothetical protein